jgi:hypothetical protein
MGGISLAPGMCPHDACVRTQENVEALASDLREAGYVVEFEDYDPDYDHWVIVVREGEMMLVSADAISAAQARIEPIIQANSGWFHGVGVETREDER